MGGLLLTLFQHPAAVTLGYLKAIMRAIEQQLCMLPPGLIAGIFGDPVLAQVHQQLPFSHSSGLSCPSDHIFKAPRLRTLAYARNHLNGFCMLCH